jgi:hypothetical protein
MGWSGPGAIAAVHMNCSFFRDSYASVEELAIAANLHPKAIRNELKLAYLAPEIVEAVLSGRPRLFACGFARRVGSELAATGTRIKPVAVLRRWMIVRSLAMRIDITTPRLNLYIQRERIYAQARHCRPREFVGKDRAH